MNVLAGDPVVPIPNGGYLLASGYGDARVSQTTANLMVRFYHFKHPKKQNGVNVEIKPEFFQWENGEKK